ncbi:unnamed protein product [Pylaiella littoralis]
MSAAAAAAADPGSPTAATADPTTPSSQEGVGGETGNHEGTPEVAGASVPVIRPALVYNKQGDVVEVLETVVQAVDAFRVPDDFVRKGAREQSYMYSLGVYCEKPGSKDHKFFCLASADCRRIKKSIPCRNGDRSNVNTHLKSKHNMQGTGGVTKGAKKKETQASVQESFNASINSGVGKNRWTPGTYCPGGNEQARRCSHTSHQLRSRCLGTRQVPRRSSATSVLAVFSSDPTGAASTPTGWR